MHRVIAEQRAADAELEAARAVLEAVHLRLRVEERARTRAWLEGEAGSRACVRGEKIGGRGRRLCRLLQIQ